MSQQPLLGFYLLDHSRICVIGLPPGLICGGHRSESDVPAKAAHDPPCNDHPAERCAPSADRSQHTSDQSYCRKAEERAVWVQETRDSSRQTVGEANRADRIEDPQSG